MIHTAILVVSDQTQDSDATFAEVNSSLSVIRKLLQEGPYAEVDYQLLPREQAQVRSKLRMWADVNPVDLVLTTGGAGLEPRDRVLEATQEVIERQAEGLAQLMRSATIITDNRAALLRITCGMRRQTLIVNLPDKTEHVEIALGAIVEILPEAISSMKKGIASS